MPSLIEGLISFFIAVGVAVLLIRAGGVFARR
jgi:hypothetical protein